MGIISSHTRLKYNTPLLEVVLLEVSCCLLDGSLESGDSLDDIVAPGFGDENWI